MGVYVRVISKIGGSICRRAAVEIGSHRRSVISPIIAASARERQALMRFHSVQAAQ